MPATDNATITEVTVEVVPQEPRVGFHSLVWFSPAPYPRVDGNYFGLRNGDYVLNMWAENLQEWARRNPEVQEIEVTVFSHVGERRVLVTDPRLAEWCTKQLHMTGAGWGSVGILQAVYARLGQPIPDAAMCGCEAFEEAPKISRRAHLLDQNDPKGGYTACHFNYCFRCKREWKDAATDEQ